METNTAADRQSIAVIPAATQRLVDLFDSLAALGYSSVTLFERTTPGARDALFAWAMLHGHSIRERTVTPPGVAPILLTICDVTIGEYGLGPHIAIQAEVVS